MKHFLLALHRFSRNGYILLISGISVTVVAVHELTMAQHSDEFSVFGAIGLILFGFNVSLKALAEILAEIAEVEKRVSARFEFVIALLILIAGCLETWSLWTSHRMEMWSIGIILIGVFLIARATGALIEASEFAEEAFSQIHVCYRAAERAFGWLRKLALDVSVGLLLILLVGWEELHRMMAEEPAMLRGYLGILLAAFLRIAETIPELLKGLELATEVE